MSATIVPWRWLHAIVSQQCIAAQALQDTRAPPCFDQATSHLCQEWGLQCQTPLLVICKLCVLPWRFADQSHLLQQWRLKVCRWQLYNPGLNAMQKHHPTPGPSKGQAWPITFPLVWLDAAPGSCILAHPRLQQVLDPKCYKTAQDGQLHELGWRQLAS